MPILDENMIFDEPNTDDDAPPGLVGSVSSWDLVDRAAQEAVEEEEEEVEEEVADDEADNGDIHWVKFLEDLRSTPVDELARINLVNELVAKDALEQKVEDADDSVAIVAHAPSVPQASSSVPAIAEAVPSPPQPHLALSAKQLFRKAKVDYNEWQRYHFARRCTNSSANRQV